MLAGDNVVKITFKTTVEQVSPLSHYEISKNNVITMKNFALTLTYVLNLSFSLL